MFSEMIRLGINSTAGNYNNQVLAHIDTSNEHLKRGAEDTLQNQPEVSEQSRLLIPMDGTNDANRQKDGEERTPTPESFCRLHSCMFPTPQHVVRRPHLP